MIECGGENHTPPSSPGPAAEHSWWRSRCLWLLPFHARKAAGFICLLFPSPPVALSDRFQPAVFEERGAVNHSEIGFINGRHVITARHSNLKSLWPKCLVSFIKTKWALGMDTVTL